jgi:hypothetical protein
MDWGCPVMIDNWNPLIFVISLAVIALIVWIIRQRGEDKKKKTSAFFAANPVPPGNKINHMYWGFHIALGRVYEVLKDLHSGLLNEYIYWFVLLMIIISVVILI